MTTIINDNTFTKTIDTDLSDREFQRLSEFIYSECGIKMPPAKKVMLSSMYGIRNKLMVWSAGCSTGEEPYTLAIVLKEFTETFPEHRLDYLILATDISTTVLQKAKLAVYVDEKVEPIPDELKTKYLLKGKNKKKGLVRIAPELRDAVKFRRLNFIDDDFGMREPMDIIFCRNVIIYFDRATQEKILNRFCRHLNPGGYVFLGHSESIHGLNVNLVQVAPTVYRKPL